MPTNTIDTAMAKRLVEADAIRAASIVGQPGGWSVIFTMGSAEKALAAQRSGHVRVWRSLDRCVAFIRDELGIVKVVQLDASQHTPDSPTRKKRTDAAKRLKRAHEAAAHDHWFRQQVAMGIQELDAGEVVTEAQHDAHSAKRRAALQRRIASAAKRKA